MGVTIFYRGTLKNPGLIREMTEEVKDIAKTMDWSFHAFDEDWRQPPISDVLEDGDGNPRYPLTRYPLKGLLFQPHEKCEQVYLLFRPDGQLTSFLQSGIDVENPGGGWVWTKTQFAGADVHISIVRLFRYLKDKYIPTLEIKDEGQYWETEDRALLQKNIFRIDQGIDIISGALEDLQPEELSDESKLLERIEEVLRKLRQRKD